MNKALKIGVIAVGSIMGLGIVFVGASVVYTYFAEEKKAKTLVGWGRDDEYRKKLTFYPVNASS